MNNYHIDQYILINDKRTRKSSIYIVLYKYKRVLKVEIQFLLFTISNQNN